MAIISLLIASAIVAYPAPPVQPMRPNTSSIAETFLPGREEDARVADISWRLAMMARARCPRLDPASGLVLQHLSQFQLADRAGILAALPLDRGPGVIVIVPDGPAATAGIRAGDVILAIDGTPVPAEPDLTAPFDPTRAHARADAVADLLQRAHELTLLRGGGEIKATLTPLPACPSRIHLARSPQRNAYADGRHVFLTTGSLTLLGNDDELAFMLAHEMAHNILGHAALIRGRKLQQRDVRALESAADRLGAEMMLDAGYDPVAGAAMLKRIGSADFGIALFADHEPVGKRIAALRALVGARHTP